MATVRQREHYRHPVNVPEDVGALRRAVARMVATQSVLRRGQAELVATELGTNLLRHADPGGYVLCRQFGDGIELLSVDTGPGMSYPALPGSEPTRQSAISRIGGSGGLSVGLASIRRMATDFDCYSTPGGTVVLARLHGTHSATGEWWRYGAVNVPHGGDGASGDAWAVTAGTQLAAVVVDGLGHGDAAATAAQAAVTVFDQRPVTDPQDFLRRAHDAMRVTRGGVAAACVIDPRNEQLTFAGVGNIAGQVVYGGDREHLISYPGTLGTHLPAPRIRMQHCRWPPGATLVMTSDGIRSGWRLAAYPALLRHDPAVIAATLYRDFTRPTDDACVLVVRHDDQ
ncbi:MAG: SpoIIE family protein phosphatase [Mycobacterium sp.]|nr:SpoIIE family protein phosphatase [Mycobacterium sp.]